MHINIIIVLIISDRENMDAIPESTALDPINGTDKSADFTVDKMTAARLLYGPLLPTAISGVSHTLAAFLPLPLSWNTLDYT